MSWILSSYSFQSLVSVLPEDHNDSEWRSLGSNPHLLFPKACTLSHISVMHLVSSENVVSMSCSNNEQNTTRVRLSK